MGILGKQSGVVRADTALKNKVADKLLDNQPVLKRVIDYFDISPMEGLQLINDPMISNLIGKFLSGNQPSKVLRTIKELEIV